MRQRHTPRSHSRYLAARVAARTLLLALLLGAVAPALATPPTSTQKDLPMHTISGRFEVKMTPEPGELDAEGIARFRLDKRYEGALTAEAKGL
jgi:hypothetical protein